MSEFKVIKRRDMELKDPVAIIGFPTIGLVGSILASYISKEKDMQFIAGMTSPELPPYTLIQNGEPFPPVRIYGSKLGEEHSLIIVTSEISPKPELCYELSMKIMSVLEEMGVHRIIALEGVAQYDDASIVICGTNKDTLDKAREAGLVVLNDGLVRGITGIMLYEGKERNMDVLALLCPADPNMPDPRASASIIEPLSKLIPDMKLDVEPLLKEASEMENRIRDEIQNNYKDETRQLYG
jgi:uncharacterized protein